MGDGGLGQFNPCRQVADAGFAALVAGHYAQQAQPHRVGQGLQLGRQLCGRFSRERLARKRGEDTFRRCGRRHSRFRHTSILADIDAVSKQSVVKMSGQSLAGGMTRG